MQECMGGFGWEEGAGDVNRDRARGGMGGKGL